MPSRDDPLVRLGSEVIGGPLGVHARAGTGRLWNPLSVLLAVTTLAALVGVLAKQHCRATGWRTPDQFFHLCYSDVPALFAGRGLADGAVPYLADVPAAQVVEYPVLTGLVMWVTALLTPGSGWSAERSLWYFDVNALFAASCALAAVAATVRTAGRRPWDAAVIALAPGFVLAGTINWDVWAVMLTAVAMLLWARDRPVACGIVLGLAVAAKFYPVLILGPLFVLCLRAGRLRAWSLTAAAAAGSWLAVNVPIMIAAFDAWSRFYTMSADRGAGFSSIWLLLQQHGNGLSGDSLDLVAGGSFAAACLAIAWLALAAPRRPRVPALAFLVVAAFLLTNKVYSPQYVLWLLPLAALARPRWRDVLIWQAGELVHFVGVWLYIAGYTPAAANRGLPADAYGITVLAHIAGTLWLTACIVRDVWRPARDIVRADGADDPAGGPLAGAVDVVRLDKLRPVRVLR